MQFAGTVEQIPHTESIHELIFSQLEETLCTKTIRIELLKSSQQGVSAE
jgi:hypothetical protein